MTKDVFSHYGRSTNDSKLNEAHALSRITRLCFGFCDCKIREFLAEHPKFITSRSMLITCIDSYTLPARLEKWLQLLIECSVQYEILGDFVWIPESDVARVIDSKRVFFGFDEIYFVGSKPAHKPVLTEKYPSDGVNFADGLPDRLASSLTDLGADRYLADGCGLNFAVDARVAKSALESNLG